MAHEIERGRARSDGPSPASGARWERRFWWSLAAAGALHVAFAIAVRRQPPPVPPLPHLSDTLDVTLLEDVPREAEPSTPEAPADVASTATKERVPSVRNAAPAPAGTEATEVPEPSDAIAAAPAPEASGDAPASSERPGLSLDALGIGSSNVFLGMKGLEATQPAAAPSSLPQEAPDRTRVAERRLKQYLVAGMLAHDRAAGASRNGAVATALQDAAMLVSSPVNGQAEFVAVVDATGLVTALRPTRVSSDAQAFRNVAAHALRALAKKRLRVPAGAAGLEVRLALSSKVQLPAGTDSIGSVHTVPLLSEDGKRLSRLDLPPESKKLPDQTDPGALGTPLMKQPIPGTGLDGDLSNLGATGRRIVHVTIVDERPL